MMMTIWVLLAMAAVMVGSAAAGAPPGRPRLGWRKWFLLFLSSAFLGCCFEVGFVWLSTGLLMSRSSLLYGPFSVVWGLGAVLMTLVLSPLRRYGPWAVFAGGAVLGGGVEYLSSLVLERTFHRLFWDYTALPFDLAGRTNLLFAVFWGGAGLVWVYWLTPRLLRLLDRLPSRGGRAAVTVLAVLFALDALLSAAAFLRMEERGRGQAPSSSLEVALDHWYGDRVMQYRYQNMTLPPARRLLHMGRVRSRRRRGADIGQAAEDGRELPTGDGEGPVKSTVLISLDDAGPVPAVHHLTIGFDPSFAPPVSLVHTQLVQSLPGFLVTLLRRLAEPECRPDVILFHAAGHLIADAFHRSPP